MSNTQINSDQNHKQKMRFNTLPEVTLRHIKEFQRYGRITANPFEKTTIGVTLGQLESLLEEGNAYYK